MLFVLNSFMKKKRLTTKSNELTSALRVVDEPIPTFSEISWLEDQTICSKISTVADFLRGVRVRGRQFTCSRNSKPPKGADTNKICDL